jgi:hypothetical protein
MSAHWRFSEETELQISEKLHLFDILPPHFDVSQLNQNMFPFSTPRDYDGKSNICQLRRNRRRFDEGNMIKQQHHVFLGCRIIYVREKEFFSWKKSNK